MKQAKSPKLKLTGNLYLSAIEIAVSQTEFRGAIVPYKDDDAFDYLKANPDIFAYRNRSLPPDCQVLLIPQKDNINLQGVNFGALPVSEYLFAVARFIEYRIPDLLPKLKLRRTRWGLERVRREDDLVSAAFKRINRERPNKLAGLHRFHRTVFRVRTEQFKGGKYPLILTVEFRRRQEITPTVAELVVRGFDLSGLDIFQLHDDAPREWLGRVQRVEDSKIYLANDQSENVVDGKNQYVESSTETYANLFEQALGREVYEKIRQSEWGIRAEEVCGRGYVNRICNVSNYLQKAGELEVGPSIDIRFGKVVPISVRGETQSATHYPPVEYCFSWDRTAIDKYPSSGLDKHGPFDNTVFDTKEPQLLIVCPANARNDTDHFVRRLRDGMAKDGAQGGSRFARGLVGTYRLTKLGTRFATVDTNAAPRQIGSRYVEVIKEYLGSQRPPDIVLVVIPDAYAFLAKGNPYLATKAYLLAQGIPSQEVRLSVVRSSVRSLPYILENIAVALYAKIGGCPWTIRPTLPLTKEVVVGMAHAQFGGRYSPLRRFMGITTVFSSDGTYLLAAGSPRCEYDQYPETLANSVRVTLSRLAREQSWDSGDVVRLVFHAPKPLTGREIDALAKIALESLPEGIQFESAFLTIETDHPFKLVAPRSTGKKAFVERINGIRGMALVGECAPSRGLVVDLGESKRLLCVTGPLLMKREGESIPQPLQVRIHKDSTYTDMTALTRQVFHFTGLSWRSMLPVKEPVTLLYPRLIANLLGRFDGHRLWSDDLLDTRLRRSRWFL